MVKKESKKCVLTFLKDSQILEENDLVNCCLSLISQNSRELLVSNHDQFMSLTPMSVISICKLDELAISEYELFLLVSDWAVAEGEREQMDVNNINSLRFVLLNVLPNIRFPTMEHEKLAIEVRNSGLLAPEELTELFAYCLSGGKIESKFPTKPRQNPSRSPAGSPTNGTLSTPKDVPRYLLTTTAHAQKTSRHSSLTKSTSRSLTDSQTKHSRDGSFEGVTKGDSEPGCDLNQGKLQTEGELFVKEMPPPSHAPRDLRRSRTVVPTTTRPRYSH